MKSLAWLVLLLILSCDANAACESKSIAQVMAVLQQAIELNEHFKQAANGKDETTYRVLRAKVETYDEALAIPCVRRAQSLLTRNADAKLLRRLMEFTISRENAADGSMADALASLFVKRPNAIEAELLYFPPPKRASLLASIDSGWGGATASMNTSSRQALRERLSRLRDATAAGRTDVRQ